ncbi:MAG TPA: Mut7-C RNAse domain-containing protein [Candidatus Methanoperedens sp.]|nr:Mut7-C RNAse domain-containing protein [Candidatus Methanoperedens sp.]
MSHAAPAVREPPPRFVCDVMLGRLARWLRALGHDTAYDPAADDRALLRRAAAERRILVTRDTRIVAANGVRLVLLRANDTPGQLRELVAVLGIARHPGLLTRCIVCNARLRPATAAEVEARAPDHVRSSQRAFRTCPGCGRVYWPGTHRRRLLAALEASLPGATLPRNADGPVGRAAAEEGPQAGHPLFGRG